MVVHGWEPFNVEPPPAALADAPLTPVEAFYSRNHGPVPSTDRDTWRLAVTGLVDRRLALSLSDLRRGFTTCTLAVTLQCAGNRRAGMTAIREIPGEDPWRDGATSTAEWTGVRLADVLGAARPTERAAHVAFEAADVSQLAEPPQPYGGSIPFAKAMGPEVLLAWAMNGRPLPAVHGGPLRVVVPGFIGARSVKWVRRVTVQAEPSDNYFQAVAYRLLPPGTDPDRAGPSDGLPLGPIALNCAILCPADGATVPSGRTMVRGYALAGEHRRVIRVDLSADGGASWQQANLAPPAGAYTWQLWHTDVMLPPGVDPELVARAWDDTGALQPESAAALWNPKGYANNSWPRAAIHTLSET
ncbi:sulfite oxidase [Frankia sp. ACN1ag]|uniref:sulfite oxidase n=1 Tax=Frankia sp. ACN1ag TaxID=102891 RepID=UPI0006DC856D|nr:sulfite oxidase [Frankia sp. ACN1ag]KQC35729.1 sulfite oxidase [Frankia sp. ACN1ag]